MVCGTLSSRSRKSALVRPLTKELRSATTAVTCTTSTLTDIDDIEALGPDAGDRATASHELGDGADDVLLDVGAGVPRTLGARRVHQACRPAGRRRRTSRGRRRSRGAPARWRPAVEPNRPGKCRARATRCGSSSSRGGDWAGPGDVRQISSGEQREVIVFAVGHCP